MVSILNTLTVSTTIYYKSKTAQVTRRFVFDTNTHTPVILKLK